MNQHLKIGLLLIFLAFVIHQLSYSFYAELDWILFLTGAVLVGFGIWKTLEEVTLDDK